MTHPIPPRSRFPFQPALIAAVAVASLLSAPARAQQNEIPANIVSLSASGHLEVPQDWLSIQLGTTREGSDPVTVQNQLKQALDDLKRNIAGTVSRLPQHQAFLDAYCAPPVSKSA